VGTVVSGIEEQQVLRSAQDDKLRLTMTNLIKRQLRVLHLLTFHYVSVQHAILFKIMRHGVLRQKRRLEADFGPYPFAF